MKIPLFWRRKRDDELSISRMRSSSHPPTRCGVLYPSLKSTGDRKPETHQVKRCFIPGKSYPSSTVRKMDSTSSYTEPFHFESICSIDDVAGVDLRTKADPPVRCARACAIRCLEITLVVRDKRVRYENSTIATKRRYE
jgi:hypothetical protein